jgi:tRNA (guanosine-2'-O-)-methyltransferase
MHTHSIQYLIHHFGPQFVIERLSPVLTPQRLLKIESIAQGRLDDVAVATEGIWDIHNAMAVIRSAEAMGVDQVFLVDCDYKKGKGHQSSRGTVDWVQVSEIDTWSAFFEKMKHEGWKLAGACPRASLTLSELPAQDKICLVLGNEHRGLSEMARESCDYLYSIPMYGMVESLNLSVAGALSLYDVTTRKRQNPQIKNPQKAISRLAWLIIRSLGAHKAQQMLEHKY